MTFLYILLGILFFGIIILIHELGHFTFAKIFKVGINEFSVGFGPKILSKRGKDGVLYSLRAIPVGGYVSMVGEDENSDEECAFCKKSVWQRIIITAAGAVMNIILGFILTGILVLSSGHIYSTTVSGFNVANERGESLVFEEFLGIRVGDTIKKVGNRKINVRNDFVYEILFRGDESVDITVERDGKEVLLKDVKFDTFSEEGIVFGNAAFIRTTELEKTFPEFVKQTFCQAFSSIRVLWSSLLNLFRGRYGVETLSGPVGVIGQVKETASYGWESLVFLLTMLTLNVGIINLLPLPAFDGGRLFFMLIELIRGKPVDPKYEGYVHAAGLVLILFFMVFITYNDIVKLIFR
ncbi:MAG: site-2 protease family protein [Clostridiales bacterium]|nr:site-2 protease family protein [Clostridiales bacterium]